MTNDTPRRIRRSDAYKTVGLSSAANWLDEQPQTIAQADVAKIDAKKTQAALQSLPSVAGWDIAMRWEPADDVSGDMVDFVVGSDGWTYGLLADVSGHGTAAALIASSMTHVFRSAAMWRGGGPGAVALAMNSMMYGRLSGKFCTAIVLAIDPASPSVRWVRAGHMPILVYNTISRTMQIIKPGGIAIGIMGNDRFRSMTQEVHGVAKEGDTFIVHTDGIDEAHDRSQGEWGEQRMRSVVAKYAHMSTKTLADVVVDTARHFRGASSMDDDATSVVLRRIKPRMIGTHVGGDDPTQACPILPGGTKS